MPLQVLDQGRRNRVEVDPEVQASVEGVVVLAGDDNLVRLAAPLAAHALRVEMGSACSFRVGPGCHVGVLVAHMAERGEAVVGQRSSFNGQTRLLLHEPGRIAIGQGCLFGPDVDVTVSDMHAIVDLSTGARLNPARDVLIADRVWLGIGTFVGKGARIGEGAVVGARSFVSGTVAANTVVAGNPLRVLRENASWRFALS